MLKVGGGSVSGQGRFLSAKRGLGDEGKPCGSIPVTVRVLPRLTLLLPNAALMRRLASKVEMRSGTSLAA